MGLPADTAASPGAGVPAPRLLWRVRIGGMHAAIPQSVGERIFARDDEGCLIALSEVSGTVVDRHPIAGGLGDVPFVVDGSVSFLFVTHNGRPAICAYNWQDKRLIWVRESRGRVASLVRGPTEVVVSTGDGFVAALEKKDGALRWTHQLRRPLLYPAWYPALVCGEGAIYLCSAGKAGFQTTANGDATRGYVLALDAANGDVCWIHCTSGETFYVPVLSGPRIYAGDSGQHGCHVYCLNTSPSTRLGEWIWRYELRNSALSGAVAGDAVYWGCYDHHLYALDAGTGALRWRFKARGPVAHDSPPCAHGDWVFAAASDGYLYGLDTRTGGLRWKYFVSPDELKESAPGEPALEQAAASELQDLDADEESEEREWLASSQEAVGARPDDEEKEPPLPRLVLWKTERHVLLLADGNTLHCFETPGVQR